jgi:transcriptional regulator with XRE-family HTH domain
MDAASAFAHIARMTGQPEPPREGFGRRLLTARLARAIATQAALGELVGASGHTVSAWEKGDAYPRVPQLVRLVGVLNVTADWLLTGDQRGLTAEQWQILRTAEPEKQKRSGRPLKLIKPSDG